LANSIRPFFATTALLSQTNTFELLCGVWVIDCVPPQAYNVFVIMAPCER